MRPIRCGSMLLMCGAMSFAGCASPPQRPAGAAPLPRASAPPALEDGGVAPEIQSLAEQSQRDVAAILQARQQPISPAEAFAEPKPQAQVAAEPRRMVIWNDASIQAVVQPPPAATQAPLFNVASEPVRPTHPLGEIAVPVAALEGNRLQRLMVDLTRELYASGAYSESPLRELIVIAAMSMVDPERRLQPQAIPDLTDKERHLLASLQSFFAELGQALASGSDTETAIVQSVTKLRTDLVQPPTISLPTTALCTRVSGFGDYAPFEKYTFLAHAEQKAILYLEIRGFASEVNPKGEYVTELSQQLVIYSDRDGIPVWKEDWQAAVDVSKNKRQDFFTVQVIALPKALSVGKYQLKVRVRDEKTKAEAETAIPFEMVADPRLAAAGS